MVYFYTLLHLLYIAKPIFETRESLDEIGQNVFTSFCSASMNEFLVYTAVSFYTVFNINTGRNEALITQTVNTITWFA